MRKRRVSREVVPGGKFCHPPTDVRTKFPNDPPVATVESDLGVPPRDASEKFGAPRGRRRTAEAGRAEARLDP